MNPELRQTLNTLSRGIESANEAAQENIFTFTQLYIDPCVNGFKSCIADCTTSCFPTREERLRRRRARSRGQADYHFDFYDDWDDTEDAGYGGASWGNDELDSLLAGRGSRSGQPGRQRAMSYGARGRRKPHASVEEDPNIIPKSSYFGFLERIPWKLGSRGLRYKPSAADLQENPSGLRIRDVESQPLMESEEEEEGYQRTGRRKGHARTRSDTQASRSTTNSLSSRGDLIMSDEEDDAVPIDDEFAVILSRRTTEDSGNTRPGLPSRRATRSKSSRSVKSKSSNDSAGRKSIETTNPSPVLEHSEIQLPTTISEAERVMMQSKREEEMEMAQKREIITPPTESQRPDTSSALELKAAEIMTDADLDNASRESPLVRRDQSIILPEFALASPLSSHAGYHADSETEPFPSMPTTPSKDRDERPDPP